MNRRLNPEIFGSQSGAGESKEASYSAVAVRNLEAELKKAQKRISHLESLMEVMQSQMVTHQSTSERRTDAFSKALSELEGEFREQSLKQNRLKEQINERFRDQRMKDSQMENMVDRFNNNLVQFENKLSTLQKVLSEKEMTLMTYRRIMEQIVDEVEKLKASRPPLSQRLHE